VRLIAGGKERLFEPTLQGDRQKQALPHRDKPLRFHLRQRQCDWRLCLLVLCRSLDARYFMLNVGLRVALSFSLSTVEQHRSSGNAAPLFYPALCVYPFPFSTAVGYTLSRPRSSHTGLQLPVIRLPDNPLFAR
jgi:hypothetical protein